MRLYVDDCLEGTDGPRGKDFNMRWIASLVADAYRILMRGGVFLYPGDARKGYRQGRLRLVYEANPMALLVEQAGGAATDGATGFSTSPHDCISACRWCSARRGRSRPSRAITPIPRHRHARPLFGNRGLLRV